MDVVELAPYVRPAGRLLDLLAVELIEAGIGIGLRASATSESAFRLRVK
jgi:hypothetical protein